MLGESVSVILRDRDDEEERGGDGQIAEVRHATEQLRRGETSKCDGRQQEPLDRCRNVPSEVASGRYSSGKEGSSQEKETVRFWGLR